MIEIDRKIEREVSRKKERKKDICGERERERARKILSFNVSNK